MGDARGLTRRRLLGAAAGATGAVALWPLIDLLFSSDRSIGFRDEGLYLLAADPPSPTARWVTPFGWHTAPFLRLVGGDIARFRTLAVWVLVLVGALFGWAVGRAITHCDFGSSAHRRAMHTGFAVIGAFGAPLLTSGLLRTPGYNWVNLVGLMVATAGVVLATTLPLHRPWHSPSAHGAAALVALGVVFTLPAKPSSPPLFALAALVFLAVRLRNRLLPFAAMTVSWAALFTSVALLSGIWPTSVLRVLASSARFPPLDRNQTIPGAFLDALRQPKVAWRDLSLLRPATLALIVAAAALAAVARRRPDAPDWLRHAPLAITTLAAIGTAVPWPLLGHPNPAVRFDWYGTTNAGVVLFVGALLHVLAHGHANEPGRPRRAIGVAGLLVAVVFIFGFGSAMSIYHQAALAAAVMWCAAAAVAGSAGVYGARAVGVATIAIAAAALFTSNLVDSRHHPFDSSDVAGQTTPIPLGTGSLLVDPTTASFVTRLQQGAASAGFCAGDPLIGVVWDWTSTTAVALKATVPEHLILTIYGYPLQADVLDVTIHDLASPMWRNGWVLTTDPGTITAQRAAVLRAALDRLPTAIGRSFPADYTLVSDVDGTQLWRPTDLTPVGCG